MKKVVAALLCMAGVGIIASRDRSQLMKQLVDILASIEAMGPSGMVIYLLSFVLGTQVMIPASPLEMAAGLLFANKYGVVVAVILGTLGKQASASFGFLLGRTLLRSYVKDTLLVKFPIFEKASKALETDHCALICIIRCAPIPTSAKSLGLAVTGVPYTTFVIVSALFGLPWTILSVLVGSTLLSVPELLDQGTSKEKMWGLIEPWLRRPLIVGFVACAGLLAVCWFVSRAKKIIKAYQSALEKDE